MSVSVILAVAMDVRKSFGFILAFAASSSKCLVLGLCQAKLSTAARRSVIVKLTVFIPVMGVVVIIFFVLVTSDALLVWRCDDYPVSGGLLVYASAAHGCLAILHEPCVQECCRCWPCLKIAVA